MSIIEEVEKLEDDIIELENELIAKKKELTKLLRGAYSHCLSDIDKHDRVYSKYFVNVLKKVRFNFKSDFIRKSKDGSVVYIEMDKFWKFVNVEDYTKKYWSKDLQQSGLMHYKDNKYYTTSIFYGSRKKCIMINNDKLMALISNEC